MGLFSKIKNMFKGSQEEVEEEKVEEQPVIEEPIVEEQQEEETVEVDNPVEEPVKEETNTNNEVEEIRDDSMDDIALNIEGIVNNDDLEVEDDDAINSFLAKDENDFDEE